MTNITDLRPDYIVGTWTIDPTHSTVAFSLKHLMISKVRGTFESFAGTIVTAENPAESTVEATVEVATVNTGQPDRDGHLRTGDFFLAEEHPQMSFRSTGLTVTGEDFVAVGDLTLRGVTKPVTLTGEFGGIQTDPYGQTKAGATATATINRTDFGMNFNAALETGGVMLGEKVTITLDIQAVLQK